MKQTPAPQHCPQMRFHLPDWLSTQTSAHNEADAAFTAGIALKTLDDCLQSRPNYAGCWSSRQALKCAVAAAQLMRVRTDEANLRSVILLTRPGDDPGPAGQMFLAFKNFSTNPMMITSKSLTTLCSQLDLHLDDLEAITDGFEAALQSQRALPFVCADFITTMIIRRPDAEILLWLLADVLIAVKCNWPKPLPLLMAERFGSAFRLATGRGRILPGDAAFAGALCLALVSATQSALQTASVLARRSETLRVITPQLRSKGADGIVQKLLNDDAILATNPGTGLSRWAATRLFDRLESLGVVRELSGRSSFKIYGL